MELTIPEVTMAEAQLNLDELSHHGILGMKWGIRRFQKYPAGYSGDGKYVGPDGKPRQPTKKEAKRDRKYNELKTKIDKWLVDAVETGDKKALKRLKKTMTPQEYQSAYDALVKTGVSKAIKEGDKNSLKAYKNDISKKDYKDGKAMADFNDAVNKMDTKRMNTLVSKIKNEEVKAAANRIATMTELQKKKIDALKVESEMSAKLEKVGKTVTNVANIAKKSKEIYDAVTGIKDAMDKRADAAVERADKINKANNQKLADAIIRKGDKKLFEANKGIFTNDQIKAFYERQYLNKKEEIDRSILTGDTATKVKNAHLLDKAAVETINKAKDPDSTYKSSWSKDIQNEKAKAKDDARKPMADLQSKVADAGREVREGLSPNQQATMTADEIKNWNTNAQKRYERASVAEKAATILYQKADMDYTAYAAKDPTGETWGDAIRKKSDAIKSTVSDLKLTPAARKAKADAEANLKKAQDIQIDAAKKVMDLYTKDPDAFLNGTQAFVDPFKFADKKLRNLL